MCDGYTSRAGVLGRYCLRLYDGSPTLCNPRRVSILTSAQNAGAGADLTSSTRDSLWPRRMPLRILRHARVYVRVSHVKWPPCLTVSVAFQKSCNRDLPRKSVARACMAHREKCGAEEMRHGMRTL